MAYGEAKWLWLAGLAFHWTFLIILIRHLRFFTQAVPVPVQMLEGLDSFLQIGAPLLYITDVIFLAAVTGLFIRRIALPQVRYISLIADYFPALPDPRHRRHRRHDAVLHQDGYREREDADHVAGRLQPRLLGPGDRSDPSSTSICSSSRSCSSTSPSASWSIWAAFS